MSADGIRLSTVLCALFLGLALALAALALAATRVGASAKSTAPYAAAKSSSRYTSASPARYPIKHIVIIDKENHSFDTMFGLFPGADGATTARLSTGRIVQLGRTPDHTLLDVGHAGDAAALAVNNGRMDR